MNSRLEALRAQLIDLRDDLPGVADSQLLYRMVTPVVDQIEKLPIAERAELRAELAGLISAFEGQILSLEQRLNEMKN